MDISGIFAISGKPGLFKSIAQSKHGVIVESLIDKKRFNAYTSYKVSSLEDITVFSVDEDVTLLEVFKSIAEKENYKAIQVIETANKEDLRAYFAVVVPTYDADRVYDSDIKKILKWYNLLHQNGRIVKASEVKEEVKDVEVAKEETKSEKPKAKAPKAKAITKEEKSEEKAVKPAVKKKAPAKKKAE